MRTPQQPHVGDVVAGGIDRVSGSRGDLYGIRVRLHGHGHRYVVGVVTGSGGPRLTSLQIESDADVPITPDTLRAIPSRRLAHAAAQWALSADGLMYGGPFLGPDAAEMDDRELDQAVADNHRTAEANLARPEAATARGRYDDAHYRKVAERVRLATRLGHPVRKTVAAQMNTSVPTVDRWIRKAKDLGLLGEDELPHRKPAQVKDTDR